MGTIYVFSLNLTAIICIGVGIFSLIMIAILAIRENKQLKLLVRAMDVMAYVTDGLRPYDFEIASLANKLSLKTLTSIEGKISSRYTKLISKLDVFGLGSLLYDHKMQITNLKKREFLVSIIERNIIEFHATEKAKMLLKLISCSSKDELNSFEPTESNNEIKKYILDRVYRMTVGGGEFNNFMKAFESGIKAEMESLVIDSVDAEQKNKRISVFDVEIVKFKASLKARGFLN